MEPYRRKQTIIGLVVAAVPLAFAATLGGPWLYRHFFPLPPPTSVEPAVELLWAKAFPGEREPERGSVVYDVAGRVRNRHTDKGVKRFGYRFELLGPAGDVLAVRTGESYLRRNEAKYIVENSVESVETPSRVRLTITDSTLVDDIEPDASPLLLQKQEFASGIVQGTVLNQLVVGFEKIAVVAILLDGAQNPIRARATHFSRLLPREERSFEIRWSNPGATVSAAIEVSTNVLDPVNYLPEERARLEQ